jgi:hypothetical protein
MVRELMECEVAQRAGGGARRGSAGAAQRAAQWLSGARWDTWVGEIELQIPKVCARELSDVVLGAAPPG